MQSAMTDSDRTRPRILCCRRRRYPRSEGQGLCSQTPRCSLVGCARRRSKSAYRDRCDSWGSPDRDHKGRGGRHSSLLSQEKPCTQSKSVSQPDVVLTQRSRSPGTAMHSRPAGQSAVVLQAPPPAKTHCLIGGTLDAARIPTRCKPSRRSSRRWCRRNLPTDTSDTGRWSCMRLRPPAPAVPPAPPRRHAARTHGATRPVTARAAASVVSATNGARCQEQSALQAIDKPSGPPVKQSHGNFTVTQIGEGRTLGEGPFAWATSRKVPKRPRTGANSGVNHPEIENEEEECYQPRTRSVLPGRLTSIDDSQQRRRRAAWQAARGLGW